MNQPTQKPKKIHELIGTILNKDLKKVYDQKSSHHGSTFYRLNVSLENSSLDRIYVFKDYLEKEQIWKDLNESNYIDQRYLFFCSRSRRTGHYQLNNWKVLKPKKNHEQ